MLPLELFCGLSGGGFGGAFCRGGGTGGGADICGRVGGAGMYCCCCCKAELFFRLISSSNLSMPPCDFMYFSTKASVFLFMGIFNSERISLIFLDESSIPDRLIFEKRMKVILSYRKTPLLVPGARPFYVSVYI